MSYTFGLFIEIDSSARQFNVNADDIDCVSEDFIWFGGSIPFHALSGYLELELDNDWKNAIKYPLRGIPNNASYNLKSALEKHACDFGKLDCVGWLFYDELIEALRFTNTKIEAADLDSEGLDKYHKMLAAFLDYIAAIEKRLGYRSVRLTFAGIPGS